MAPLIPIEDDAPLTRSELKALTEANTAFLMEQMKLMIEGLMKPKDPNGLIDPNTSNVAVSPSPVVNGANASTPSTEDSDATSKSQKAKNGTGTYASVEPPLDYGGCVIPMPHINSHGPPPKLDIASFANWQSLMKSHICSASTQLWRVI